MKFIQDSVRFLVVSLSIVGFSHPIAEQAMAQPNVAAAGTTIVARKPIQIPTISLSSLPREAQITLSRIRTNGPFPYRQDGTVFSNREQRLPAAPKGYYREYTVPTPGSPDRGARRLIMGQSSELYYTRDHYRSFFRVK